MPDDQPPQHPVSPPPSPEQIKRRAREAAALRANLLRRKDQARAREGVPTLAPDAPDDAKA